MIINSRRHGGFPQVASYHMKKVKNGHAKLLFTNLIERSSAPAMAREFQSIAALNPRVKRSLNHVMISLPPDISLTETKLRSAAHWYIFRMGYRYSQAAVWLHTDTDNQHIHLLLNQVRYDTTVVPDDNAHIKQEGIARELEEMFELPKTPSSLERRRQPSKKEQATGIFSPATEIAMRVHAVLDLMPSGGSFKAFAQRLVLQGVVAVLFDRDAANRFPRLFYWYQGHCIEARGIDPASTIDGLSCREICFENVIAPGAPVRRLYRARSPKPNRLRRNWRVSP